MKYSEAQIKRLRYLLSDEWVTDDPEQADLEFDATLAQFESPHELHQYAANFNWDGGCSELQKVIRHPLCDKGTALMIYFLGGATFLYLLQQRRKPLIGEQPKLFAFLKEIEIMFERNEFKSRQIKFDPSNARGRNFLAKDGAEILPLIMKQATEGEDVEILNLL